MSLRSELARIVQQEDINFLLTNRIPRRLATRFLGWFSQIENPVVARASIGVWQWTKAGNEQVFPPELATHEAIMVPLPNWSNR